ncbi:MAG: hypothetical protein PSY14_06565 [bacterium]|nr:hypothetical protein [bacterium]
MPVPMPRSLCSVLSALAFLCALQPHDADARPVSYAGGWMLMANNDMFENTLSAMYSPKATYSIGPFISHYRDTDGELAGMQFNWLAKRWNNPDSQGNLYFLSGLGIANDDGDARAGGYAGIEADWEDRRYYLSYENRYTAAGEGVKQEFQQRSRIGIAPYVAEAGSLHSWLMLQVDHNPEDRDTWTVTPLLRVFKGDYLAEAGISDSGRFLFNIAITY